MIRLHGNARERAGITRGDVSVFLEPRNEWKHVVHPGPVPRKKAPKLALRGIGLEKYYRIALVNVRSRYLLSMLPPHPLVAYMMTLSGFSKTICL